jgi:glycosyltransferase involved in cell wall biosynthesis
MNCCFLFPGDLDTPAGGYRYDRRIVHGLRELGWQVTLLSLAGSYPQPDDTALVQAEAALAALPDGTLVVADGLAFAALPALVERHAPRLCWVALVHHPLWLETGLDTAAQARLRDSERRALACARQVIVTSNSTALDVQALGVPAEHIAVVEPGVDAAPLALGARHPARAGRSGEGLCLLCVASLLPRKGHRVLIEALAGLRDRAWTLICVGSQQLDPSEAAGVQEAIAHHGLGERVQLDGVVHDDAALGRLYAMADLFVLPSFYEGYGMVLTEALARGLPIVSTTGGAIAQTVPPAAGVLVAPRDAVALRAALARVIDDAAWREQLAAGARAARMQLPRWHDASARFAATLSAPAPVQR